MLSRWRSVASLGRRRCSTARVETKNPLASDLDARVELGSLPPPVESTGTPWSKYAGIVAAGAVVTGIAQYTTNKERYDNALITSVVRGPLNMCNDLSGTRVHTASYALGALSMLLANDASEAYLRKFGEIGGIHRCLDIIKATAAREETAMVATYAAPLLEVVTKNASNRRLMMADDTFLQEVLALGRHPNLEVSRFAWGVVLFLAMDPACHSWLLDNGVMDAIEAKSAADAKSAPDSETMQKFLLIVTNFIKDFPPDRLSRLSQRQRELFLNAGMHMATIFQQGGKTTSAIELYENLDRVVPNNPFIKMYLGNMLVELGKVGAACDAYREALRANPRFLDARSSLARVLIEHGGRAQKEEAVELLYEGFRMHRFDPKLNELFFILSRLLEELNRPKDAIQLLRDLVAVQPHNSRALQDLGRLLLAAKNPKAARKALEKAYQVQPHDSMTLYLLGLVYQAEGSEAAAGDVLARAVQLNPDVADGLGQLLLGKIHMRRKEYKKAAACFEAAAGPKDRPEAHYEAGVAWSRVPGSEVETEAAFSRAVRAWKGKIRRMRTTPTQYFARFPEDKRALLRIQKRCGDRMEAVASSCEELLG